MNVVDYVILGVVGISLLFGLYRGFITSVLGLLSVFAAMFVAYAIGPTIASAIYQNQTVVDTLVHYTDATSRIGDAGLSVLSVTGLDAATIADIVSRADLPAPFDAVLSSNLAQQVFSSINISTVTEYLNQTIITSIVSVISYLVVFIVAYLALTLIIGLFGYVFRFPTLKHLDLIFGGIFGIVRGVFVVYIFFALVPILMTVLPFEEFGELVNASQIGSVLYQSNIVTTILQGHL